ncbi:hypothetical protein PQX77_002776 [Marasmius sp. AFHP31]|nr:hypothetical protein PQX77_002776 [Marasmius sp. AFHP31]
MFLDEEWDDGLAEYVQARFSRNPTHFHLERGPTVPLQDESVIHVALTATGCPRWTLSTSGVNTGRHPFQIPLRLTDCHCYLSVGKRSDDPGHLAYQEACIQLVRAFVAEFRVCAKNGSRERKETDVELTVIFETLLGSWLLNHCPIDTEMISLCNTFFETAQGCELFITCDEAERWRNMLFEWTETFPEMFTEEGRVIRGRVIALPWQRWERNEAHRKSHDLGMGGLRRLGTRMWEHWEAAIGGDAAEILADIFNDFTIDRARFD